MFFNFPDPLAAYASDAACEAEEKHPGNILPATARSVANPVNVKNFLRDKGNWLLFLSIFSVGLFFMVGS